jgi:hypothetical protein
VRWISLPGTLVVFSLSLRRCPFYRCLTLLALSVLSSCFLPPAPPPPRRLASRHLPGLPAVSELETFRSFRSVRSSRRCFGGALCVGPVTQWLGLFSPNAAQVPTPNCTASIIFSLSLRRQNIFSLQIQLRSKPGNASARSLTCTGAVKTGR